MQLYLAFSLLWPIFIESGVFEFPALHYYSDFSLVPVSLNQHVSLMLALQ